jgi:hypothetical protein
MSRGETCEDGMGQSAGSLEGSVSGGVSAKGSVAWGGARDWKKGHDRECVGFGKRRNCTKGAGIWPKRAIIQGLDSSSDSEEMGEQIRRDRRVVEVLSVGPVEVVEYSEDPFPVSWDGLEEFGIVNDGEKLELVRMENRVVEAVKVELVDIGAQADMNLIKAASISQSRVEESVEGLPEFLESPPNLEEIVVSPHGEAMTFYQLREMQYAGREHLQWYERDWWQGGEEGTFTKESVNDFNRSICCDIERDLAEGRESLEMDVLEFKGWMRQMDEKEWVNMGWVRMITK